MKCVIAAGCFMWAGALLGVSFIATPAKFLAPSLPLPQALDVGRWTFHVLALIEWTFAALFVCALVATRRQLGDVLSWLLIVITCIAVILVAETFWLRPILDDRVSAIIRGEHVPPSHLHQLYIGLEAIKLSAILAGGIIAMLFCADGKS
jgi:hypothetical protein